MMDDFGDSARTTTSMNNNNNSSTCVGLSPTFWTVYSAVYDLAYYGLMPTFLLCGLTGHLLGLIAFSKEAHKDAAYTFQVFVAGSQAVEIVFYVLYVLCLKWWSGAEKDSAAWFRNQYPLVWYTAHLATPVSNMCITNSLLVSLCMAVDRFWALYRPHAYRHWNHKRNRAIALVISASLGVSTSLFAVSRYQISENDTIARGRYTVVLDVAYASTTSCVVLSHVRNFIRISALVLLIVCNTANWKLFRARVLRVATDTTVTAPAPRLHRKIKRLKVEAERTLFILVIVESTLTAFGMTALTAYFFAIFTAPGFTKCSGLLMIPLVDMLLNLASMGKFYIVLVADKRFRTMMANILLRRTGLSTTVAARSELATTQVVKFDKTTTRQCWAGVVDVEG